MKTDWLPAQEEKPVEAAFETNGVRFKVALSPYDVPQAVRSYVDGKHYIVEFKYLTDEPTNEKIRNQFTRVVVGQNSQRLYKIIVDLQSVSEHLKQDTLSQVEGAITGLRTGVGFRLGGSYELAQDVVTKRRDDLCEPLTQFEQGDSYAAFRH